MHLFCLFSHSFSANFRRSNNSVRCSISCGFLLWSAFTQIFCWVQWQPNLWWKGWVLGSGLCWDPVLFPIPVLHHNPLFGEIPCRGRSRLLPSSVSFSSQIIWSRICWNEQKYFKSNYVNGLSSRIEYSYSFADAIRSDRTSSISVMDNREI